MKVQYTIQIVSKGSVEDDLEKTVEDVEKFNPIYVQKNDEYCNDGYCSAFVEVLLDASWGAHVDFARRFLPVIIEPVENVELEGVEFYKPLLAFSVLLRRIYAGKVLSIPKKKFGGKADLDELDIERLIIEDRKNRVNIVLGVPEKYVEHILAAFESGGIVNDYKFENGYLAIDFISSVENIVLFILHFFPVGIQPVEPVVYDLRANEVADVLMIVSEKSRAVIKEIMKRDVTSS